MSKRNPNYVDPNAGATNIRVHDETYERIKKLPVSYGATMDTIVKDLLDCWESVKFYGKDPKDFIEDTRRMKEKSQDRMTIQTRLTSLTRDQIDVLDQLKAEDEARREEREKKRDPIEDGCYPW